MFADREVVAGRVAGRVAGQEGHVDALVEDPDVRTASEGVPGQVIRNSL